MVHRARPEPARPEAKPDAPPAPKPDPAQAAAQQAQARQRQRAASTEPFTNSVFDAGVWVDGSDPDLTTLDTKPGTPRDLNVLPHGNVAAPRELAPRHFLSVLAKGDPAFHQGSGRLALAHRILTDSAPLAARVI